MKPQQVTVILNGGSGRKAGSERASAIRAAFAKHDVAADIVTVRGGEDLQKAAQAAANGSTKVVVVSGGDGTISAVASALAGSDREMGVIPSGTFNYFARSLNLPETIEGAVEIIVTGRTVTKGAATINGRIFLNNASIGAYAAILQTREGIYRRWGRSRFAAYWSVIKALATLRAPLRLRVDVDGKEHQFRTPIIFAVSNAFQLDQMGLGGRDCIAAGKLVLLVAPNTNRWGLFKHAAALALGVAKQKTDYEMYCGSAIEIDMKRPSRHVARDGELSRMSGPFGLRVVPGSLNLRVAQDYDGEVR